MLTPTTRRGFSLIELLVIVTIIGVIVMLAVPNFGRWAEDQRLRSSTSTLEQDLQLARMTAINRVAPVTVRFAAPPTGTTYTAFVDNGAGGGVAQNLTQDGTEAVVFRGQLEPGVTLSLVDFNAGTAVLFNARGLRGQPTAGNARAELQSRTGQRFRLDVGLAGNVSVTRQ